MRILAWNVGHQTHERPMKPVFSHVIQSLAPDVLVLNEYVDGDTRNAMKQMLRDMGLGEIRCSTRNGIHNQILIASRGRLHDGSIAATGFDEIAASNVLSVHLDEPAIEVVGFRTPAYELAAPKHAFWKQMDATIRSHNDKPVVFIGDMNADPAQRRSAGGRVLSQLASDGWQVPTPVGEWSYCGVKTRTRIDHAVASPSIRILATAYWPEVDARACAGRGRDLYDHAPLTIDLAVWSSPARPQSSHSES